MLTSCSPPLYFDYVSCKKFKSAIGKKPSRFFRIRNIMHCKTDVFISSISHDNRSYEKYRVITRVFFGTFAWYRVVKKKNFHRSVNVTGRVKISYFHWSAFIRRN